MRAQGATFVEHLLCVRSVLPVSSRLTSEQPSTMGAALSPAAQHTSQRLPAPAAADAAVSQATDVPTRTCVCVSLEGRFFSSGVGPGGNQVTRPTLNSLSSRFFIGTSFTFSDWSREEAENAKRDQAVSLPPPPASDPLGYRGNRSVYQRWPGGVFQVQTGGFIKGKRF